MPAAGPILLILATAGLALLATTLLAVRGLDGRVRLVTERIVAARDAAAREPVTPEPDVTEVLDTGVAGVREVHLTISAIPFDLLDRIPPARLVRVVHDRITAGVYDAVSAANRVAAGTRRRDRPDPDAAHPIDP